MRAAIMDRDLRSLAGLAVIVALRWMPDWLRGLTAFWGDLTYLHQPWRAFDAELLAAGRLPLWNPYLYLGMPQAAAMQDGLYYPGSAPYWIFGFATATAVFQAFHYWLAGALAYLALRSMRLLPAAAFGGVDSRSVMRLNRYVSVRCRASMTSATEPNFASLSPFRMIKDRGRRTRASLMCSWIWPLGT